MAILHVRNVPDEIYQRIQQLAEGEHRSVSAEVIQLLERALLTEERRREQSALLDEIHRFRYTFPPGTEVPDSVELIREDRYR